MSLVSACERIGVEDAGEGRMDGDNRGLEVEDGSPNKQGEGKETVAGAVVAGTAIEVPVLVVLAVASAEAEGGDIRF